MGQQQSHNSLSANTRLLLFVICLVLVIALSFSTGTIFLIRELYIPAALVFVITVAFGAVFLQILNSIFLKMSEQIDQSRERARLESEMAIASLVQHTLIPPSSFENDRLHIQSFYQSASQCGGDWWGFFGVGNKFSLVIADATGHGLPSALLTASARSCFSVIHKMAQEDRDFAFSPAQMLSYANRVVYDAARGEILMTCFAGVIDFDLGTLTYASAAHNPPWLFKKEKEGSVFKSLTAFGPRLGEIQEPPVFQEFTVPVKSNDMILLYTDGLLEGKNLKGEMFGKRQVKDITEAALPGGPVGVIQSLTNHFMRHNEGKLLDDDLTVAMIKLL